MNRLHTPDDLLAFVEAAEECGHTTGALQLWDSGDYALIELAPGRVPVDIMLIDASLYELLRATKAWKDRIDAKGSPE